MVDLPYDYLERVKRQLGASYPAFLKSYEEERAYGLRYNPLKIEKETLRQALSAQQITTEQVPWAAEGLYYPADTHPGRLPLHEAGAYYIQEPSAMVAVELLDPQPGESVLDLCAAPGGKSTQIAGRLQGKGLLVCNEVISKRAKALSSNIERMGVTNAVVLNETPQRLAERFPAFFDRILVDAPCSGEGMFRKDVQARGEWSYAQTELCAKRQREILAQAVQMLKPGGVLVYATCTFAPQENEQNAAWLVQEYPSLRLTAQEQIWPHLQRGEGHFAARFIKEGTVFAQAAAELSDRKNRGPVSEEFYQFCEQTLTAQAREWLLEGVRSGRLAAFGEQLYLLPPGIRSLDGLKTERAGLQLGCCKKRRFEPSHALAMALHPDEVSQTAELAEPERYLRGEQIGCGTQKGWTLVTVCGCSAGWGKASAGVLKNHYPKGLRR